MREIKFRAWNEQHKDMIPFGIIFGLDAEVYSDGDFTEFQIMQYTGLKDKNGVEIYEGDVIQGWDRTDEYGSGFHYQSFVEWSDYEGMWVAVDKDLEGYVVEQFPLYDYQFDKVIGNIYENPELLT